MATQNNSVKANFQIAQARIPDSVKNLTIGFPNQPGKTTLKDADENTTISGSLVTAEGLKIRRSSDGSTSTVLEALGGVDSVITTWTLTTTNSKPVIGTWHISLYQDSVLAANRIPNGANIDPDDYQVYMASDWGALPADKNDISTLVAKIYIRNLSNSSKTVLERCEVRYIINMGEL